MHSTARQQGSRAVTLSERDIEINELASVEGRQIVHLSGDLAFPSDVRRVRILKDGPRRIIVPADHGWDRWYDRVANDGATRLDVARDVMLAGGAALRRFLARPEWAPTLLVVLFLAVGVMFVVRARVGLVTLEFGDETEKYVAAQMLRHGRILFVDIYLFLRGDDTIRSRV
jgi:antitoxin VapB